MMTAAISPPITWPGNVLTQPRNIPLDWSRSNNMHAVATTEEAFSYAAICSISGRVQKFCEGGLQTFPPANFGPGGRPRRSGA